MPDLLLAEDLSFDDLWELLESLRKQKQRPRAYRQASDGSQMKTMRGHGRNTDGLIEWAEKIPEHSLLVEVGSYAGESAAIFAGTGRFKEIICIDKWPRREEDPTHEQRFDAIAGSFGCIRKIKGRSTDVAHAWTVGAVDAVYIDAGHCYRQVLSDIDAWRPHIRPGGFIGGHDHKYNMPGVIRAVFERFNGPDWVFRDSSWLVQV